MPLLRFAVFAAVLAGSGCVSPSPDEPALGETVAPLSGGCSEDGCGNPNSPIIDGVYFWRLHSDKKENDQGVKITKVTSSDGQAMRLVAQHDRLLGVDPDPTKHLLIKEHDNLNGTIITVAIGAKEYEILIQIEPHQPPADYEEPLWVGPFPRPKVEAYRFHYRPLPVPPDPSWPTGMPAPFHGTPLCKPTIDDMGGAVLRAIVFTGDNYDPATKHVSLEDTQGWMNIACEGSAPWKMHLIGHTTAAAWRLMDVPFWTTPAQRQSMLNAFTMNACGTGKSFTVHGTMITLSTLPNVIPDDSDYVPDSRNREAIWSPRGAECLDAHRLATSALSNERWKAEIGKECTVPPPCDSLPTMPADIYVRTGSTITWPLPEPKKK